MAGNFTILTGINFTILAGIFTILLLLVVFTIVTCIIFTGTIVAGILTVVSGIIL